MVNTEHNTDAERQHLAERKQRHWLMSAIALSYFALGLGVALTTVYLTDIERCPLAAVAAALTCSGALSIFAAQFSGRIADRWGAAPVLATLLAAQCLGRALLVATDCRSVMYVAVICTNSLVPAAVGMRSAITAQLGGVHRRARLAASGRAAANLCYAVGAAAAGAVLAAGSADAYRLTLTACAGLTGLACATAILIPRRLSTATSNETPRAHTRPALTDLRFLGITASAGGLLMFYDDILALAFPLLIIRAKHTPMWICSVALLINALGVGVGQVAATRRVHSLRRAAHVEVAAATLMALACAELPWAMRSGTAAAIAALLTAAFFLTAAEILQSAGAIILSFDLAPPDRHGDYQGVFSSGYAALSCLTPSVLGLIVTHPSTGWYVLAATLILTGAAVPALAGAADRRRALADG